MINRRQKILVIDDSQQIHQLLRARLKGLSVDLIFADNGEAGITLARDACPDLILLDVNMPGQDGFDVCRILKDNPATYEIPVIFLTGVDESLNKVKGFDLGAVDYVTKPFDPAELRARVRTALHTRALMELLTTQAQLDGLTGLHNRRYFDQRLEEELSEGRRYGRPVGLLLVDIDHFKSINDTFGHPKGDLVLRKIAGVIKNSGRASDITCRYGGEEFAVVLPQSPTDFTYQFGLRLLELIRQCPDFMAILGRSVTVSIGAACAEPEDRLLPPALVNLADKALYSAKASGRDRVAAA